MKSEVRLKLARPRRQRSKTARLVQRCRNRLGARAPLENASFLRAKALLAVRLTVIKSRSRLDGRAPAEVPLKVIGPPGLAAFDAVRSLWHKKSRLFPPATADSTSTLTC